MKRKRGRKPGGKRKAADPAESTSPDSASSPSTEASDSPRDQAEEEDNSVPPVVDAGAAVPEPPPPPPAQPSEPPRKPTATAPANPPADITYSRPKVGAVYGRVKLKFKSSKTVDSPLRPQQQDSLEAQGPPPADAGTSEGAAVPEVIRGADAEKAPVLTDGQQADGQGLESSDADKEKVARKVGGIKIKLTGLPSVENSTPDRKADSVDEPPSKQEALLESKETEDVVELRSSQESEEKQSTPEHQRNEKELSAALEAIKKVMKMDAADPFNVPVLLSSI